MEMRIRLARTSSRCSAPSAAAAYTASTFRYTGASVIVVGNALRLLRAR